MANIEKQRMELREICKKYGNCNGCPLDDEGCKALEILERDPANTEAVFAYLEEKGK